MHNESRHPISLWVAAFALCSALQVFRGNIVDEIIFFSSTVLILLSTTLLRRLNIPAGKFNRVRYLEWAGIVLLLSLGLIPRHSQLSAFVLLVALAAVLPIAWGATANGKIKLEKRESNARLLWSAWAVAVCLWEFAANILGQLNNTHTQFPTISLLLDPILNSQVGKAGFVVAWLMVGFGLLNAGKDR